MRMGPEVFLLFFTAFGGERDLFVRLCHRAQRHVGNPPDNPTGECPLHHSLSSCVSLKMPQKCGAIELNMNTDDVPSKGCSNPSSIGVPSGEN